MSSCMSLLKRMVSVGAWVVWVALVRGFVGDVGQILTWVAWVAWVCKILAWVKKMAWMVWVENLAWAAWVHKIDMGPNFGICQKNGLYQNKME